MDYQLGATESVPKAFDRLGSEIIAEIRAGVALDNAEGTHQARKGCKWLRALLRLLRTGLDAGSSATQRGRIRRVARMLGTVRDATIRLTAFRSLGLTAFESLEKQLEAEAEAEQSQQSGREGRQKLQTAIDTLERGWKSLRLKRARWRQVTAGIERSYRRARRGLRRAERDPSDLNLHEWRKRSKELMYHVRLLRPIKPKRMSELEKDLDDLSDWLGYDHDLIVLSGYIRQYGQLKKAEREDLRNTVHKHRKEHLTAARHAAAIIFEPKPADFARELKRWSKRWRAR
jgi:CHAD domain-containing protein